MAATNNRSVELRAVAIVLWCLATIATMLRVYVRVGMMKAFTFDDWAMTLAMFSFTANTITCVVGTFHGSGRHMVDLSPESLTVAMKFWWACYPTFAVTMVAAKFSVGFLLLRITTQRLHQWIIYVALGATLTSGVLFFFVAIFQCTPVASAWDKTLMGTCLSLETIINVTYGYSTFAIITDFTFTLLPAWLVFHLQMNKKTKLVLIPILSMACIASSAVAVRLGYLDGFKSPDFLWATTDIAIWSQVEQGLAIAAGSFAVLRPLFRIILYKLGISSGSTTESVHERDGNRGHKFQTSGYAKQRNSATSRPHNLFHLSRLSRTVDEDVERGSDGSTVELGSCTKPFDCNGDGICKLTFQVTSKVAQAVKNEDCSSWQAFSEREML